MNPAERAGQLIADAPQDGEDGPSGPSLVKALRDSGLLAACARMAHHPENPLELLDALQTVGRASLSAGRLFEGHVNAVKLVILHRGSVDDLSYGALYGIWGADGGDPARIEAGILRGQKQFASGADVLDRIIVTAKEEGAVRLLLLDRAQLDGRLFPQEWQMSGMKATASGRCNLDGLSLSDATLLGPPNAYLIEPHFHGGVWRYAAVQLGAMRALTAMTADQLQKRGQAEAPLQAIRLHQMILACETARLWLGQAALAVERPGAPARDAEAAILARLRTAAEATSLLSSMDQALGAASFATAHPADRIRRDLSLYLRQANPDGLALASTNRILADPLLRQRWAE